MIYSISSSGNINCEYHLNCLLSFIHSAFPFNLWGYIFVCGRFSTPSIFSTFFFKYVSLHTSATTISTTRYPVATAPYALSFKPESRWSKVDLEQKIQGCVPGSNLLCRYHSGGSIIDYYSLFWLFTALSHSKDVEWKSWVNTSMMPAYYTEHYPFQLKNETLRDVFL